jgi:hypothetical protein
MRTALQMIALAAALVASHAQAAAANHKVVIANGQVQTTPPQAFDCPPGESRTLALEDTGPVWPRRNVTVEIFARLDSPPGGSNPFMALAINGQAVADVKDRGLGRLLNKSLESRVTSAHMAPWFFGGAWRVPYATDYSISAAYYEDNPYRSVLDVTDLIASPDPTRSRSRTATPPCTCTCCRSSCTTRPPGR